MPYLNDMNAVLSKQIEAPSISPQINPTIASLASPSEDNTLPIKNAQIAALRVVMVRSMLP
jgi:hypothetical protein